MNSAFPFLAAAALLLGASTAQAARPMGHGANSNIIVPATPPLQSSVRPRPIRARSMVPRRLERLPSTRARSASRTWVRSAFPIRKASARCPGLLDRRPSIRTQRFPPSTTRARRLRPPQERRHRASAPQARAAECKAPLAWGRVPFLTTWQKRLNGSKLKMLRRFCDGSPSPITGCPGTRSPGSPPVRGFFFICS